MKVNSNSGFFPGFLDPDGRPWLREGSRKHNYDKGIESAIKIALLTQKYLVVPAGYLLDNPILQRIFIRYGGGGTEAMCFKKLMIDLIRVSPGRSPSSKKTDISYDWRNLLSAWTSGSMSGRGQLVYLNCLDHVNAIEAQELPNEEQFELTMRQGLLSRWEIDLDEVLDLYKNLRFRSVACGRFGFDDLLRSRLLSGREKFQGFDSLLSDKVSAVAEAVSRCKDVRLSRSLLRNKGLCIDIGVSENMTLSSDEYDRLSPVLAHYHHMGFAQSIGLDSFITYHKPSPRALAQSLLNSQLQRLSTNKDGDWLSFLRAWPLTQISFQDIYTIRLGKHSPRFYDNLNRVRDVSLDPSAEITTYQEALREHLLYVAQIISFNFKDVRYRELVSAFEGSVFSDEVTPAGMLDLAKYCMPILLQLIPNIRKDISIRMTLRKISSDVNNGSITS